MKLVTDFSLAARPIAPRSAGPTPILDLDFAAGRYAPGTLGGMIAVTREGAATRIGAAGLIQAVAADLPRLDHDPETGTAKGLLIEESRTNLATGSADPTQANWSECSFAGPSAGKRYIQTGAVLAPDGTMTGSKLVESTDIDQQRIYRTIATQVGTSYTYSVYLRAAERPVMLRTTSKVGPRFDLEAGTLDASGSAFVAQGIAPAGAGWFRCWVTFAASGTLEVPWILLVNDQGAASYAGDGASGVYFWGVQVEAGQAPSSYIPTTTAAVTRAADAVVVSDSGLIADAEGILLVVAAAQANTSAQGLPPIVSREGAGVLAGRQNGHALSSDGINMLDMGPVTGLVRHAIAWSGTQMAASVNGGAVRAAPYDGAWGPGALRLGGGDVGALLLRRLAYFPGRLQDADLRALTA